MPTVLTKDRRDEAWAIVKRLHGGDGDDAKLLQFAREEFYQMTEQVRVDSAVWNETGWKGMLTKKSYQKRFWMGFFIQYAAQSTGAQVIYGMLLGNVNGPVYSREPSIHYHPLSESWSHRRGAVDTRGCLCYGRMALELCRCTGP